MNPFSAVTAPDPYPYYAQLVAKHPFYRDDEIAMWVASSAQAVDEVLTNSAMRVRPTSEPVPKAIARTIAGDVFSRFARMTDGPQHDQARAMACTRVEGLDIDTLATAADECARRFAPADLDAFVFTYPTSVIATVLGISVESAPGWTGAFVRSVAAGANADDTARGSEAAGNLWKAVEKTGLHDQDGIANAIGLLFQTYDATAALIANTLLAFATGRAAREQRLENVIAGVVRNDSPVQNTRRFVAASTQIMGTTVYEGDTVLVLLGAANRDPLANGNIYTFGLGPHACPGARIACTIAQAGVAYLLEQLVRLDHLVESGYRPYPNIRMPDF